MNTIDQIKVKIESRIKWMGDDDYYFPAKNELKKLLEWIRGLEKPATKEGIEVLVDNGSRKFKKIEVYKVMPTIREMPVNHTYYFPMDWDEAVRTATSILRTKEDLNILSRIIVHKGVKYIAVRKYGVKD